MDDFAHLVLGYALWRAMRIIWPKMGKFELGVILLASVLPDLVWAAGLAGYVQAHTIVPYLVIGALALVFGRTRLAGVGFFLAASAHILIDAMMHVGTWRPLAPYSDWAVAANFNYWNDWGFIAAYWAGVLLILAGVLMAEKMVRGRRA